jgi:hypothetical protein
MNITKKDLEGGAWHIDIKPEKKEIPDGYFR